MDTPIKKDAITFAPVLGRLRLFLAYRISDFTLHSLSCTASATAAPSAIAPAGAREDAFALPAFETGPFAWLLTSDFQLPRMLRFGVGHLRG